MSSQCPDYLDPDSPYDGVIPVSGHWDDTLYGLLNYNYKCLRNLPNKKKGKRSPGVIIRFKILAFFMF
ncbi:hypothetical protein [Wolbachia endosymbiont (group A) of Ennomos erosarius]|uniref:hypothetical protein n=1 Tax=Wolbachia endosymbiont (group A) of Ennomos erosarius TaxID=3066174 RepID=UPI00333F0F2B